MTNALRRRMLLVTAMGLAGTGLMSGTAAAQFGGGMGGGGLGGTVPAAGGSDAVTQNVSKIVLPFEITVNDPGRRTIIRLPGHVEGALVVIRPRFPDVPFISGGGMGGMGGGMGGGGFFNVQDDAGGALNKDSDEEDSHEHAHEDVSEQPAPVPREPRNVEVWLDKADQPDADPDALVATNNSLLTSCQVLELAAPDAGAGETAIVGTVTVYFGLIQGQPIAVGGWGGGGGVFAPVAPVEPPVALPAEPLDQ